MRFPAIGELPKYAGGQDMGNKEVHSIPPLGKTGGLQESNHLKPHPGEFREKWGLKQMMVTVIIDGYDTSQLERAEDTEQIEKQVKE